MDYALVLRARPGRF